MWNEILKEGGRSLWRELGEDTVKKAVGTLASESVKAVVEIWKKRRIRQDAHDFKLATSKTEDDVESEDSAASAADE